MVLRGDVDRSYPQFFPRKVRPRKPSTYALKARDVELLLILSTEHVRRAPAVHGLPKATNFGAPTRPAGREVDQ